MDPNIPIENSLPEFTVSVTYNNPIVGIHTCILIDGRKVYMRDNEDYWKKEQEDIIEAIRRNIDDRKRMMG